MKLVVLFNIVWKVFLRFYIALIMQRLLCCIHWVLGKNWRCRKCQKGYCMFGQVLGCDKGFLIATKFFWFRVVTGVPCVVTWFSGFMQFLGRDIALSCRDSVFASL